MLLINISISYITYALTLFNSFSSSSASSACCIPIYTIPFIYLINILLYILRVRTPHPFLLLYEIRWKKQKKKEKKNYTKKLNEQFFLYSILLKWVFHKSNTSFLMIKYEWTTTTTKLLHCQIEDYIFSSDLVREVEYSIIMNYTYLLCVFVRLGIVIISSYRLPVDILIVFLWIE